MENCRAIGCRACILLIALVFAGLMGGAASQAAPPEGKGQEKTEQGQGREDAPGRQQREEAAAARTERSEAKADNRAERAEARSDNAAEARVERQHPHQERIAQAAADRTDNANGRVHLASAHGRSGDPGIRGRDAAKAHVDGLLKSLNKLEHARWDYNPHDTRGQGNMGKVDMRDPFGFDKDSGREGAERGRAIHEEEPVLDLSSMISVDFGVMDTWLQYYAVYLDYLYYLQQHFNQSWNTWLINWVNTTITAIQSWLASYQTNYTYDRITVNDQTFFGETVSVIDYTMDLLAPDSFVGTTLSVTTELISANTYTDLIQDGTNYYSLTYTAGQVVYSETDQVTLGTDSTYTFSYNPPDTLAGWEGGYFQLRVTVTDPVSGASYSITYDRQLYLYRCPYGIIYDKTTGRPVVGATVTVHNADGSIVMLDKAANPNVSNPQTTDATGRYNCKLAIGQKYYLTVKAPGYEEYKSPLFSERWHIVREDVGLTPVKGAILPTLTPALGSPTPRGIEITLP